MNNIKVNYVSLILFVPAILCIVVFVSSVTMRRNTIVNSVAETEGTVLSAREFRRGSYKTRSRHRYWRVIIEYEVDGHKYKTEGTANDNIFHKGETDVVRYDPHNPEDSYIPGAPPTVSGGYLTVGLLFLILGIVQIYRLNKGIGDGSDMFINFFKGKYFKRF